MLVILGSEAACLDLPGYLRLRQAIAADPEFGWQLEWAETLQRPACAEDMALELVFIVANSGMKAKVARGIFERVKAALLAGEHPSTVFGHKGKAEAMHGFWQQRDTLFVQLAEVPDEGLPAWCKNLPWIGGITCYHAAKNLGCTTVAKPDRWLERVARNDGTDVQGLCKRLSDLSGDNVATVDLVIWWACAHDRLVIRSGMQASVA